MAFLLPTVVFCLTPIVLFAGRNRYRKTPPAGSVLGKCMRVLTFSVKKTGANPLNWIRAGFWERALPSRYTEAERPSYMTWDDAWVWEVRKGYVHFPLAVPCYTMSSQRLCRRDRRHRAIRTVPPTAFGTAR